MVDPLQHYRIYQDEYERLWEQTAATGDVFEEVEVETRKDLLD